MSARQILDRTIRKVTGEDIRLVGIWHPLPGMNDHSQEIAAELGVTDRELSRCRDIADVLDLMGDARLVLEETGHPSLF